MTAASYKAALVRAMGQRCGLDDPDGYAATASLGSFNCAGGWRDGGGPGRTTRTMLAALVALEAGCSVTIEVRDAVWAGYISAQITSLACKARLPDGIWQRFSLTWLEQADVYLVDHAAMTGETA